MTEPLFSQLTATEKRRALELDDFFLQCVLKSRHGAAVVGGVGVDEQLALAAKLSDEDIRRAIEIVEWHKQALAASDGGDHQAAIVCFEKIIHVAPFDAISWMSLGVQHANLQNGPSAVECLERALVEDPDNERIRANLKAVRADFEIAATSPPVATPTPVATPIAANSTIATNQSDSNPARMKKSKLYLVKFWETPDMEAGRKRGHLACDCCQTPIAVNAGCLAKQYSGRPLSVNLAELQSKVAPERFQRLAQQIAQISSLFKQVSATAGADYHNLEDRVHGLLSEFPFDNRLLLALGVIQFKQHKLDDALAAFSAAKRCAPADSVIHYHLGKTHEGLGQSERALRDYDRARRLDFTSASMRKAYYRLEHQIHAASKSSKALPKAKIEKLVGNDEHDKLVCLGLAAVEGLAQVIGDQQHYTYHEPAATVLSRIGEPAVSALVGQLRTDKKTLNMRAEVLGALSLIASDEAIRVLSRARDALLAAQKLEYCHQHVVAALLRTGDAETRQAVLKDLRNKSQEVRLSTLNGLSTIDDCSLWAVRPGVALLADAAVADALVERCQTDADPECREAALQGLPFTRLANAPRVAAARLKDSEESVRSMAASVLKELAIQHVPLSMTGGTVSAVSKRGDVWDVSGWTGDDGAIASLIPLLGKGDQDFQRHIGHSLGLLGDLALPALVVAAQQANDEVRVGLGWVSQTMHDAGRQILADSGVKLAGRQRGEQVIKVQYNAPSALPGDCRVPIPNDHAPTYLFRDSLGHDHALQVVYYRAYTLWGLDRDELPEGTLLEAITHSQPGEVSLPKSNVKISEEVRKLNDALPNVWSKIKFATEPCTCCGIRMPTSEESDFMNLGFLGLLQNNPQAIATAIQVTAAYYQESSGPDLSKVNMLFARGAVFNWARMQTCSRCKSWTCKRCEKLPHDQGGCSLCTRERKRRAKLPSLVCETCFTRRHYEPWEPAARSAGKPDIAAMPIPRRDKATQVMKPFYEKWSVTPVAECAACGLLMPTESMMQPLLVRAAKESGLDYTAALDASAKLFVMVLGAETLGEPGSQDEREQLLHKWHLTQCPGCRKSLCPACVKIGSSKHCVVCEPK